MSPIDVHAFNHNFTVDKGVKPVWQFDRHPHPKRHENFVFFVKPKLSDSVDIILGNVARQELGIQLCAPRTALVAQAYHGG